jgi:hypothetical protein
VVVSNRSYAPEEQFGALSGGGAHHRIAAVNWPGWTCAVLSR